MYTYMYKYVCPYIYMYIYIYIYIYISRPFRFTQRETVRLRATAKTNVEGALSLYTI